MNSKAEVGFWTTETGRNAQPFVSVAAAWGALGAVIVLVWDLGGAWPNLAWYFLGWALCCLNLSALFGGGRHLLILLSAGEAEKRRAAAMSLVLWLSLKGATLIALLAFLFKGKNVHPVALMMGLATLILVPLLGGALWGALQKLNEQVPGTSGEAAPVGRKG